MSKRSKKVRERGIKHYYSKKHTFLKDEEVIKLAEEDLPIYMGKRVDSRQLSEIYHTYILLTNIERINFTFESGEKNSYIEGILEKYSKKKKDIGEETPNSEIIYNFSKEVHLNTTLKFIVESIELFRLISKFDYQQLLEYMDQHNTWQYFTNEYIEQGNKGEIFVFNSHTIKLYNADLDFDEITELLENLRHDIFYTMAACDKLFDHIDQSAAVLKHLILYYEISSEQAFKSWYHSKTKQYIDDNNLYTLSVEECLRQFMQEGKINEKEK